MPVGIDDAVEVQLDSCRIEVIGRRLAVAADTIDVGVERVHCAATLVEQEESRAETSDHVDPDR
jgi:hypothetical protein